MEHAGFVDLVNATPFALTRTVVGSRRMRAWDDGFPETIAPHTVARVRVAFPDGVAAALVRATGEVTYAVPERDFGLTLRARGRGDGHLELTTPGASPGFATHPAPARLAWRAGGTVAVAVVHHPELPATATARAWMGRYAPLVAGFRLAELALPCSHDSGTYDMVSPLGQPLTRTQRTSLAAQLALGVRVLDLRVGQERVEADGVRYVLVHDVWRTEVTLERACDQVVAFLDANPHEIVVLDFHRFVPLDGVAFDEAALATRVAEAFADRLLPPEASTWTLREIWSAPRRRLVVAWNRPERDARFWPGVDQHWHNVQTKTDLRRALAADFEHPRPSHLWSACVVLTPAANARAVGWYLAGGIPSVSPDASTWFAPSGDWSRRVNAVAVDWVEETGIADACIVANLLVGARRRD